MLSEDELAEAFFALLSENGTWQDTFVWYNLWSDGRGLVIQNVGRETKKVQIPTAAQAAELVNSMADARLAANMLTVYMAAGQTVYVKLYDTKPADFYAGNIRYSMDARPDILLQNLLLGGDFEDQNAGRAWTEKANGGGIAYITEDGSTALKLTGKAAAAYVTQKVLGNGPYARYRLSFRFKTDTEGTYPYVSLPSIGSAGNQTGTTLTLTSGKDWGTGGTSQWQEYSYIFSFDEDAASDGVTVSLRGAGEGIGVYYDDVTLSRADMGIYDAQGKLISTFAGGETLTVRWRLMAQPQAKGILYAALYENSDGKMKLIELVSDEKVMGVSGYADLAQEMTLLPLSEEKTYILKMFCWGECMQPQSFVYVIRHI